jgi:hypothetical protein
MISARQFAVCWVTGFIPLPAAALCVANGTEETLFFTVEATETGTRQGRKLGPGETLCLPDSKNGVVAAFESSDSLEGCSRLAKGGDRLLTFARFDRCTWESHLKMTPPDND